MIKGIPFLSLLLIPQASLAKGIGEDLMSFFKKAGLSSNVTTPGSYKDQTAGFYTGGSIVARNGARNAQIATIQMPGFRAGCGGIDLWMGGFSHIKSQQVIEMARNIGSATPGYAFMLAVQNVSPQIYNIMNELNNLATQINQTNINSCEVAATALGGVWPRSVMAMDISCHSLLRVAKLAEPLMKNGGCILTTTYYGAEKVIQNYGIMGPVKAALEACVKYSAAELGKANIRVNALSPGPIATRAASGIAHFDDLLEIARQRSPEHENICIDCVGTYARFLVSDEARLVTGSIAYVDAGFNIMAT